MTPKISVIIPVYNSAKYLSECLESIQNQTFSDFEIVAIDDGSTDGISAKRLDDFAEKEARMRVLHTENRGVSAARNAGLSMAQGDYVLFVDSDDFLSNEALETAYRAAIDADADVVITDHDSFKENGAKKKSQFFAKPFITRDRKFINQIQQTVLYGSYSPLYTNQSSYLFGALWTKLIRRSLLKENNIQFPLTISLFEDGMVALQIFQFAKCVVYVQKTTYHYRVLNASLCHSFDFSSLAVYQAISKEILQFLSSHQKSTDFYLAYDARFVYYVKKQIAQMFSAKGSFFQKYLTSKKILNEDFYRPFLKKIPQLRLIRNERIFAFLAYFRLDLLLALLMRIRRH